MRIAALRLLAYGPFTDRSLEFGDKPGFHLVYGDNEAGKSTALRALSSVLFGYPHVVIDDHKHDAKDILLGADLAAKSGSSLSFQRRRRGKNALVEFGGSAIDEASVARVLGDVSRDVFESVFALDHDRLHKHAQALLSGGGSLGVALAAAGVGLAGLKAALDQLRRERNELFLSGGSRPEINRRISRLQELRKEMRQRQVSLPEFKKREREIADVEERLAAARSQSLALDAELTKLQRLTRVLPLRARLVEARAQLVELADVPSLSANASELRIKAESARDAATAVIGQADTVLGELAETFAKISVDESVLQNAQAIEELAQRRSSVEDAERSIPRRDAERDQFYRDVRDNLAKAEIVGPATELGTLLPSLVKRKQVDGLARKGREIATKLTAASGQVSEATEALTFAQERVAALGELQETRDLDAALQAADELGDIETTIANRARGLSDKKKLIDEEVAGLGLPGSTAMLRALVVPADETVARYRQSFSVLEAEEGKLAANVGQLNEQSDAIERRVAELTHGVGAATREQLQEVRDQRDAGWALVRGVYIDKKAGLEERVRALVGEGDLAQGFELKTQEADRTADTIIAHSKEAAELSLSIGRRDQIRQSQVNTEGQAEASRAKREVLQKQWMSEWPVEVSAVKPPTEMATWLKRRETLLREDRDCQTEAGALASLKNSQAIAKTRLAASLALLKPVNAEADLSALRIQARAIVTDAAKEATRRAKALEALEIAQSQAKRADEALLRLEGESERWAADWRSALSSAGMPGDLSIDAATTVIEIMAQLDAIKPQIDQLTRRIDAMKSDVADYGQAIEALGPLATAYAGASALEISRQLSERLRQAREAKAELQIVKDRQKLQEEAKSKAEEQLAASVQALAALCHAAGCEDAGELVAVEQRARRKQEIERVRDELEARIVDHGLGMSLAELLAECEGADGASLPGSMASMEGERKTQSLTVESLMNQRAELLSAFNSLFSGAEAGESRQSAAIVEAEIESLVQRYSDLALQEVVLRQAIELYRERNQGPILGRAKGLFSELTNGAYAGLRADVNEKNDPILIAEHAERGSLEIEALSDGTVDSLYLALRLAAVQEHNATREPLPFVADDLLLNFDNARSLAAMRILSGMTENSQVLFFTHHEHMIGLAEAAVAAQLLTVHRL